MKSPATKAPGARPSSGTKAPAKEKERSVAGGFAFGRENYLLMIAGMVVIAIGFLLMSGGKAEDVTQFNENEIFSTRRVVIAPLVVMLGYAIELFAILKKSKE